MSMQKILKKIVLKRLWFQLYIEMIYLKVAIKIGRKKKNLKVRQLNTKKSEIQQFRLNFKKSPKIM